MQTPMKVPTPHPTREPAARASGPRRPFESGARRCDGAVATAGAFAAAVAITLFVGLLSLSEQSVDIPAWANAPDAKCMRVQRRGDVALASVAVGSPPRLIKLLVRLDHVVEAHEAYKATVVFTDELLRSETLRCDGARRCTDIVLLSETTTGRQARSYTEFQYGNAASTAWSTESYIGADGAMRMVRGWTYALTRTHVCWAPNGTAVDLGDLGGLGTTTHTLEGTIVNTTDSLVATHASIERASLTTTDNPFRDAPAAACNSTVELFPAEAVVEQRWLALSSTFLYEASTPKLNDRRRLVERGLACAEPSGELEIYQLDCALDTSVACRTQPSLPYRHVSQYKLELHPSATNDTIIIRADFDVALSRITGSLTITETVFFASVRLFVLLIVAFVVYARAERQTASAFYAVGAALDVAAGVEKKAFHTRLTTITDAVVGVLAVGSRLTVLLVQAPLLVADRHTDGVVFEAVGVVASILHFFLRNLVLDIDLSRESPLQKLGGSMALADAANAALFSVISTPTLQVSTRDFDAVARLFVGVLIAIFVVHRCFFSTAACALLATTASTDRRFDPAYSTVLWSAALLWLAQTASVAFGFGRFFAVPQAYSIHRSSVGDANSTEATVFLTFLVVGVPVVNGVLIRLARARF